MSHVLVICAKRYNGHELWTLLGVLQQRKHTFEVVSQELIIKDELTLRQNITGRTVYDVPPSVVADTDAIIVVSGNMADTEAYWTDKHVETLLQAHYVQQKVCAAICCSVPTLAPIAKDRKVSFFPLVRSRHRLLRYGALLQPTSLTVDGNIVTAENQMVTQAWATEICNLLEGKPQEHHFTPSGFTPRGRERRLHPDIDRMVTEARAHSNGSLAPPNKDVHNGRSTGARLHDGLATSSGEHEGSSDYDKT